MNVTVSELMVMMKAARSRLTDLRSMRNDNSVERDWYSGGQVSKVEKPQYDVKVVDAKCSEIESFLLNADTVIKRSNSITHVDIAVDMASLLAPIK